MKYILFLTIFSMLFSSCNTIRIQAIRGDYSSKFIDLYKVFDLPDSTIIEIENEITKINPDTIKSKKTKQFVEDIQYGVKNKLTRTPYIWIENKRGKSIMLFLDPKDYKQFDTINCLELNNQNMKLQIEARGERLKLKQINAYKNVKIKNIRKIEGNTNCGK